MTATNEQKPNRPLALALTALAGLLSIILRIVPHPANFTPVGAMGLFGGARLRAWQACVFSLGIMVLSDLVLWAWYGFQFSPIHLSRAYIYPCFLAYVLIGWCLKNKKSFAWVTAGSLLGSLQFFVVSNFFVWVCQPWEEVPASAVYTRDLSGLLTCYVAALPFFQGESLLHLHGLFVGDPRYSLFGLVAGDLIFCNGLFLLEGALGRKPAPAVEPAMQTTQA